MIRLHFVPHASRFFAAISLSLAAFLVAGCGGNDERNAQPKALFYVDDQEQFAPVTIAFDGSGSSDSDGEIVSHEWSFGDGVGANGISVEHEFTDAGTYSVVLTVVDDQGGRATHTEHVTILPAENVPPVATIAVDKRRGKSPLTVELSAAKSKDDDGEIVSYLWQFSSGETSAERVVEQTYIEPGDYSVHLIVTDDDGAQAEDTMTLTVLKEDATFSVSGTITASPYTDVDGDVNDPFASFVDNNGHGFNAFQPISNPVLLNGFVTDRPTGGADDRFAFGEDYHDTYSVELSEGDYVSLRVVDTDFAIIDLYLLDADSGDIVMFSSGDNEFESVRAPAAGNYLIMVNAANYFSKYVLRVGGNSLVEGPQAFGKRADFEPDQAIIKFRAGAGEVLAQSSANRAQLNLNHPGNSRSALAKINRMNPQTRVMLNLQSPGARLDWLAQKNPEAAAKIETIQALSQLGAQPDVEYAEPNYRVQASYIPTDPAYIYQWHYPAINLPQAWDRTRGDPNVVVAVIDSGVYLAHPDLQGKLTPGYDFISSLAHANDGDGIDADPDDPGDSTYIGGSSWHGTHVSGVIVAAMDNDEGGVGVAPDSLVMPLRALGRGGGLAYDILQSVRYAAGMENDSNTLPEKPADIINLSLGGSGYSQASQNLYNEVREKGILVVAAAGNENTDEPMYPASYAGVISVGATDFHGERAPYSNRSAYLDVVAPGGVSTADENGDGYSDGILSAVISETPDLREGDYAFYQGTSMAAPHVSGVAALMKSVHPSLTPEEFESLLISGALTIDKGEPGRDNEYGYGLLDAQLAVSAALSLAEGASTAAIYADRNVLAFDAAVTQSEIELRAIGNDVISITGAYTDADWLKVEAFEVDADGIGTYSISVDTSGLEDGTYRGFVRFDTDRETEIRIQVSLRVGEIIPEGDAGFLYVLLIDALTGNVAVEGVAPQEGKYEYSFTNVPVGEYYVAAGSDIDNDSFICEQGESCGYYPSLGDFTLITLDRDRPETDFSAGLSESFSAQSSSAQGSSETKKGISRLPTSNYYSRE